ncbi:MAG: hypothetical protein IJ405_02560 [Lachnospiraceae bacterium]|nr:hypothetical protein [Lachnospiraceae bacterium]
MAMNSISKDGLQRKGAEFESYAENLMALLQNINEKVNIIAQDGVYGNASTELLNRYEEISGVIKAYADKINALGGVVKASAEMKGNIDIEATKAAGGSTL